MKTFEMEIEITLKGLHTELIKMNETKGIDYEKRKYEVMKDVFSNTIVRKVVRNDEVSDTFIERALEFSKKSAEMFISRLKSGGERK